MVCDMFDLLFDSKQDDLPEVISKFALELCSRIDKLEALQIDANVSMTTRYLPVRRCELLILRPREFYEMWKSQRERLPFTFTDLEIIQTGDEFNALERACASGTSPSEVDQKSFDDSWKPYGDCYFKLRHFVAEGDRASRNVHSRSGIFFTR